MFLICSGIPHQYTFAQLNNPKGKQTVLSVEDQVVAAIQKLPEYKKLDQEIYKETKHKHHIAYIIQKPDNTQKFYEVDLGFDGPERFEQRDMYYVDPRTFKVFAYDDMAAKIIPIEKYRNRKGD